MKWLRAELEMEAARADVARGILLMEGVSGWEESEAGESACLVFHCPVHEGAEAPVEGIVTRVRVALEGGRLECRTSWVDDEDWAHSWKRFWKPQRIGRHFIVAPSWEPVEPGPEDRLIRLDPGMAFGTGTHETTRMCLEWLEEIVKPGDRILDVGTGSGLLSVGALMLGAASVIATDFDPLATTATRENLAVNGFAQAAADVRLGAGWEPLREGDGPFQVIVANLVADLVMELAPGLLARLAPGGRFVGSGIIVERVDSVKAALELAGFTRQTWRTQGEWASVEAMEA